MSDLRGLYPMIEPYATGMLDVGQGHSIYYERSGQPGGKPAIFLHGGPGGRITPEHRRLFNPDRYDVLLFEQRGCGRSLPHAGLEANTSWHLVADIERLREEIAGCGQWLVLGESWGTTLALAYAERFPLRISALLLQGIYTATEAELRWSHQFGISELFPEEWERYQSFIPGAERSDMIAAYRKRLMGEDRTTQLEAARAWGRWEAETMTLLPDAKLASSFDDDFALAFALIESHYIAHRYWLDEGQVLRDAHRLHGIPGAIIQGRYDMPCPAHYADALHKAWPAALFHLVEGAGHAFSEPAILNQIIRLTDRFAGL